MNIRSVTAAPRWARAVIAIAAMLTGPQFAHADLINVTSDASNSTEGLGEFTGTVDFSYLGGNEGTLVISLTNTSDNANGGLISGFLFNIESNDASASLVSTDFPMFLDAPGQSGVPFGDPYAAGAALEGDFLGGGSPVGGIAVGQTGTFTFNVVASDASSLTAASFINGPFDFDFLVRFKGFVDGGSDKVPAMLVPGPGSLALIGLGALIGLRRRRQN